MVALIAKCANLEAFHTSNLCYDEMTLVLRAFSVKIRSLELPTLSILPALQQKELADKCANVTVLKLRNRANLHDSFSEALEGTFHAVQSFGRLLPQLYVLEFDTIDSDTLEVLIQSLSHYSYLRHLRYLRIEDIIVLDIDSDDIIESAKTMRALRGVCLDRGIELTTLRVNLWPEWRGCWYMT